MVGDSMSGWGERCSGWWGSRGGRVSGLGSGV